MVGTIRLKKPGQSGFFTTATVLARDNIFGPTGPKWQRFRSGELAQGASANHDHCGEKAPPYKVDALPGSVHQTRNGNCLPGTIVESGITSPYYLDWFQQSHDALQGTARPAHCFVLENGILGTKGSPSHQGPSGSCKQ